MRPLSHLDASALHDRIMIFRVPWYPPLLGILFAGCAAASSTREDDGAAGDALQESVHDQAATGWPDAAAESTPVDASSDAPSEHAESDGPGQEEDSAEHDAVSETDALTTVGDLDAALDADYEDDAPDAPQEALAQDADGGAEAPDAPQEALAQDADSGAEAPDSPQEAQASDTAEAAEDAPFVQEASAVDALEEASVPETGTPEQDEAGPAQDGSVDAVVEDAADGDAAAGGRTIGPACEPGSATQTVSFVHVNDLHAAYIRDATGTTPFEKIKGFEQQVRSQNPHTVFVNAGDDHEKGSVAELLSQGLSSLEVGEAMQFDVKTIGNHDFAWNPEGALRYTRDPHAAVVCTNIDYEGPDPAAWGALPYVEVQVGCVRVGFFGLASGPWNDQDQPYQGRYYPDFPMRYDYIAVAQEIIAAHRSSVDLLVLVSHLGYDGDLWLASQVTGIDVVLGGHSHSMVTAPQKVGATLIVQASHSGRYVARLDVTLDLAAEGIAATSYSLVSTASGSMPVDPHVQATIDSVVSQYAPEAYSIVGHVSEPRDAAQIAAIAAKAALAQIGADAAAVDPGTVWTLWTAGPLTQQSMADTFKVERESPGTPGFSGLYTATVDGSDLQTMAAQLPAGWGWAGPDTIDPGKNYVVALQKRTVMHPGDYFPSTVSVTGATFASEVWEVLDGYARARTSACKYMDADLPLTVCP